MTSDFVFQLIAKNSLIKNTVEEEKSLTVEHDCFFFWKIVPYWVYLARPRRGKSKITK